MRNILASVSWATLRNLDILPLFISTIQTTEGKLNGFKIHGDKLIRHSDAFKNVRLWTNKYWILFFGKSLDDIKVIRCKVEGIGVTCILLYCIILGLQLFPCNPKMCIQTLSPLPLVYSQRINLIICSLG